MTGNWNCSRCGDRVEKEPGQIRVGTIQGRACLEFLLVHGYSGDLLQVQKENQDIDFVIPVEGTSIACDDLVIPKGTRRNRDSRMPFHRFHPQSGRGSRKHQLHLLCVSQQGELPEGRPGIAQQPGRFPCSRGKGPKCEVIEDLGQDTAKYTRMWDQIKAAP